MSIYDEIMVERQRQISDHEYSDQPDDFHTKGQIAQAASCYALAAAISSKFAEGRYRPEAWPWHLRWWKPSSPRRMLIKSAALIVAEVERIDRRNANPAQIVEEPEPIEVED